MAFASFQMAAIEHIGVVLKPRIRRHCQHQVSCSSLLMEGQTLTMTMIRPPVSYLLLRGRNDDLDANVTAKPAQLDC